MTTTVSAVLEFDGPVVRYADVERSDGRRRLARLGRRHLGGPVFDRALRDGDADALSRVAAVIATSFSDVRADRAVVVVHPPDVCSFFMPVASSVSGAERKRQVTHQVALLAGVRSLEDLHLRVQTVRKDRTSDGDALDWLHVLAVPAAAHTRARRLFDGVDVPAVRWMLSTEAAARTAAGMTPSDAESSRAPYGLTVGLYRQHSEYALVRDGAWTHGHAALDVDSPQDRVYHVVALLNRLDIPLRQVGRLFAYGNADPDALAVFEAVVQADAERLRPFRLLSEWDDTVDPATEGEYAACIGAGL